MEAFGGAEGQGEVKCGCSKAQRSSRYFQEEGVASPIGCTGEVSSIRTEEDPWVLAAWGVFGD